MVLMVKEVKVEERELTFTECCVLSISIDSSYDDNYVFAAKKYLEMLGCVSHEWNGERNESGFHGCTGSFRKETTRPATTKEIQAYHFLKATIGKVCCSCIFVSKCSQASHGICCNLFVETAEKILEGKEVYEE